MTIPGPIAAIPGVGTVLAARVLDEAMRYVYVLGIEAVAVGLLCGLAACAITARGRSRLARRDRGCAAASATY